MKQSLIEEKNLYFKNKKDYLISCITQEHNYLIWRYIYFLRKEEQALNIVSKYYYRTRKNVLGSKLGIMIYANTTGKNLRIWHYGSIIVNGYAKIGEGCILHGQNCIGNNGNSVKAPVIGNNVDIGVGASVLGDIYIADNVKIGAGAVCVKSCYTDGATLVGAPAHEICGE